MDYLFKPIVLVTGFGPFVNHPINASWEAVKLMNKEKIEKKHNIELVQLEIPVTYQNVDEFVPALWETHEPKLMIHVGVSKIAKEITLEKQAHRKGYQRQDYFNERPANHTCTADGAMRVQTKLNVEKICKEYNESNPEEKTSAVSSLDAGRFLCEYIYYTSLTHDNTRTLFVHVPDMNIYSSEQTARALERILDLCMDQILEGENEDEIADELERANLSDNEDMSPFQSSTLRSAIIEYPNLFQALNINDSQEYFYDATMKIETILNSESSQFILKDTSEISNLNGIETDRNSKKVVEAQLSFVNTGDAHDASSSSFITQLQKALDFRSDL